MFMYPAVIFLTLALDQISKIWLIGLVQHAIEPIAILPFFNLVMVWNNGISFGILHESDYARELFILTSTLIIGGLLFWMYRTPHRNERLCISLIIGGAVGNVIDRLRYGAVADFFDVHVAGYHWPAFNIADSAVCVGAVVLCLCMWKNEKKNGAKL